MILCFMNIALIFLHFMENMSTLLLEECKPPIVLSILSVHIGITALADNLSSFIFVIYQLLSHVLCSNSHFMYCLFLHSKD